MTQDPPLVTIVTPSFNQAKFLETTIRSVLEQNYPRKEYFVIDGGSTDGSLEIIRKYSNRLDWWISEKDTGQADAINKGLKRAKGEIVMWLNSDDVCQPGAVTSAVEAFRANPLAGVVYGDAWSIDEKGKPFHFMRARQYSLVDLLAFCTICQPAAFMRRLVLERAGYLDTTFHYILDHYLWIRMAKLAPIVYIPQTWALARFHEHAKNRKSSEDFAKEASTLLEDLQYDPQFSELISRYERDIFSGISRFKAFYLTDAGKPGEALKLYWRAFTLRPLLVIKDWKHVVYAKMSLLGLHTLRKPYDHIRSRWINQISKRSIRKGILNHETDQKKPR